MRAFRYEGGATRQFHLDGQHDQQSHAGGGAGTSESTKPNGGGKYVDLGGPGIEAQALKPKPNTIFTGSTRLQGVSGYVMDDARADLQGMKADGYITIEQGRSKTRSFLKPTGKLVAANRTRPGLVEFDQHEVDTVAEGSTVMGRPGKVIGKQYALIEMFPEIPDHLGR